MSLSLSSPDSTSLHDGPDRYGVASVLAKPSKELILMWNSNITSSEKSKLLEPYSNQITITHDLDNFMLISTDNLATAQIIHDQLTQSRAITSIEYNQEIDLHYTDDAYTVAQWSHKNPGYYAQLVDDQLVNIYSVKDVDLEIPEAWSIYNKKEIKTREVVVAVIDTGVDNNHPDLSNSMWINQQEIPDDGIDNDKNGYIDDVFGWDFYNDDNSVCHYEMDTVTEEIRAYSDDNDDHGTHIAGIIAATADNDIGIAGIASNIDVKIMALKIHGGPNSKGSIADAILAIKYATAMGADVVNLSWGSSIYSKSLEQAIAQAPMLFVTAAGNTGANNDLKPMYPANFNLPNILSVTFINEYGSLTVSSNYGKKTVDIAAPGTNILSTVVAGYDTLSGSSMAAPHVTGLAAILYSCSPNLSPESVKKVITSNTKELDNLHGSIAVPGIPNAFLMVQSMAHLVVDTKAPKLNINTYFEKDKIMLGLYPKDEGGSNLRVMRYLSGTKTAASFKNGTIGTLITENTLALSKGGTYSFYLSDYAGNETVVIYDVIDDKVAPYISSSHHYSLDNKTIILNIKAIDELSDIKILRYTKGNKTLSDFSSGALGTPITLVNNKYTLRLTQSGEYTFYAVDYRGNKTIYVVDLAIKPITTLSLENNSYTMMIGDTHKIKVNYAPGNTTDKIYFVSSNPSIVSVSQWGNLHARSKGKAVITIRSTSGIVRKLMVTIQ